MDLRASEAASGLPAVESNGVHASNPLRECGFREPSYLRRTSSETAASSTVEIVARTLRIVETA